MLDIPVLPNAEVAIPRSLARISDLAHNMWWSWNTEGRSLWVTIDPVGWEQYHNPIDLLSSIDPSRWHTIEQIESVHERYNTAVAAFDTYMSGRDTWYRTAGTNLPAPVAYLCTEFGIHHSLPFYSGGLGILAGDHIKSASDMGLPLVAVGLLYRRGYFHQEIDGDGDQQHFYPLLDFKHLPARPVAASMGGQLKVPIEFPGRTVWAAVWKLDVGTVPLLMLDTDLPENHPADRPITHQLYVSGREMRFCQELVLGVGSVMALDAIGITPSVWHVNEGHAAMSLLERVARGIEAGHSFEEATKEVRDQTIFTLHTPVPAGNETFELAISDKYMAPWAGRLGMTGPELDALASPGDGNGGRFDLGALAIRHASVVNGVSQRHGEIVTRDWKHLIGHDAAAVTNGVHTPTWIGRELAREVTSVIGPNWASKVIEDDHLLDLGSLLSDQVIWRCHVTRKEILSGFARGRIRLRLARNGASPDILRAVESILPADRLTLGFARRFATYKRATLLFVDKERLLRILTNPERPVQLVFAGKAHPADQHGQALIREIAELASSPAFVDHVFMIEDYESRVAKFLVQGVDVWMNNPRPPMEASGTSGMKAAINGALNCSVLDGWWIEGYNGLNGWAFGRPEAEADWGRADQEDSEALYTLLEEEIVPLYYDRDAMGVPTAWVDRMRESMVSTIAAFSSHRMVADYSRLAYFPLGSSH